MEHPVYAFSANTTWSTTGRSELGVLRIITEDGLEGNAFWGSFHRDTVGGASWRSTRFRCCRPSFWEATLWTVNGSGRSFRG